MSYEIFECTEKVNIGMMCKLSRQRGIGLYQKLNGILVTALPDSDEDIIQRKYELEVQIEKLVHAEEFEFCESRKRFKSLYSSCNSRSFCMRLGRLLQLSLRNCDNATLPQLSKELFSFLLEEKIISENEFIDICSCLGTIWVHREDFSKIYASGLYEQCLPKPKKGKRNN